MCGAKVQVSSNLLPFDTIMIERKVVMSIPKDPMILVSYINTQLRDFYPSLEEFCKVQDEDMQKIIDSLASIDYHYDKEKNQFI